MFKLSVQFKNPSVCLEKCRHLPAYVWFRTRKMLGGNVGLQSSMRLNGEFVWVNPGNSALRALPANALGKFSSLSLNTAVKKSTEL
ncbi:MAG: hypothetical protein HC848_05700 [Limnobacter sp.]|nr:hypothetical protein [Limnobacter sp.]